MPRLTSRQRPRRTLLALLLLTALPAVGMGVAMIVRPIGVAGLELTLLDGTPFASFRIPGVLLALLIGGSQTAAAVLLWREHPLAPRAVGAAALLLAAWIAGQALLLRGNHWMQATYFVVAALELLILAGLGPPATRRATRRR